MTAHRLIDQSQLCSLSPSLRRPRLAALTRGLGAAVLLSLSLIGCASDPIGTDPSDLTGQTCESELCGPAPGAPAIQCDDGSTAGFTGRCLEHRDGSCTWEVLDCPDDGTGGCTSGGQSYDVGDNFPSEDGCNSCSCTATGAVCTERACAPDLKWYASCGDPVCRDEVIDDPEVPNCSTEAAGDPCSEQDVECELLDGCGRRLVCTTSDPTQGGECPISRAAYKNDVQYLSQPQVEALSRELLGINLATYRYNANVNPASTGGDPGARHLGFIIDDIGQSQSVNPDGQSVNLYGYTSMAVAALQVQAREIQALRAELEAIKKQLRTRR